MDTINFLFSQMLIFAIPLLIVALAGLFSERSGVINIALEGIMIFGAFVGILFMYNMQKNGILTGQLLLIASLLVAGISGALFSALHAFASINVKANQTISGTALNLFAPALGFFVAKTIFDGLHTIPFTNEFIIERVPFLSDIPVIGGLLFNRFYITTFLGLIILIISWFVLYRTKVGLHIRACGEYPQAADAAAINVYKTRYIGVVVSGFLAGIGGLVYVIPITTEFGSNVASYGFLALAVLIFGNWNPWRIAIAALFFATAKTLSVTYTAIPFLLESGISPIYFKLLPYVATLILLAFTSKNSASPKALGEPYDKGKR